MGRVGSAGESPRASGNAMGGPREARISFSVDMDRQGNVLVVAPHGRITELVSHELEGQILDLIEQGVVTVIVDLDDVPYISSAGLGALMLAYKEARKKDGDLRLARCQPLVRQILETTKLTKLFGVYATVKSALAAG